MPEKPTYSMSASLLNSLRWHKHKNDEKSFEDLKAKVYKQYDDNVFTVKGHTFEDDALAGNHKVLNKYLNGTDHQVWFSKVLDFGDFNIRLSGKADAVTKDRKHIYDIKRVQYHYKGKYDRDKTIQHDLYMFLNDAAEDFTYLIAANGKQAGSIEYITETYQKDPNAEEFIKEDILEFLNFLYDNNLINEYMKTFEFMGKYK